MIQNPKAVYNFSASKTVSYVWSSLQQASRKDIPTTIKPWLAETGSLTAKLQKLGELSVDVLFDRWDKATSREQKKLGLHPRTTVRVREVILSLNGIPVIYARSIIPATALKGHWRHLTKLGEQPLGSFLFKTNNLSRGEIEIAQLPPQLFSHLNQPIWARRSIFYQYGQGVLVNEAFFPSITDFLK